MKANLYQHKICEAAAKLFLNKGFDNVGFEEIAQAAGLAEKDVYKYFGSRQDIILFLYQRINADWEIYTGSLSEKPLSVRFEKSMLKKIELIAPYTGLLGDLMGLLVKNSGLGVSSPRTRHIRIKGIRTMQNLLNGSNSRFLKRKAENLPALLYLVHWTILFLHIQNNDLNKTKETISLIGKMLQRSDNFLMLLSLIPLIDDLSKLSALLLEETPENSRQKAERILSVIFNHRKLSGYGGSCQGVNCRECFEKHLPKVEYFLSLDQPVHFILPAFPAKSPNRDKVLGELPDLGEETALITLENMCREIADAYPPGAKVTICSDGRIFAELVGVTDEQVTNYGRSLAQMIEDLQLQNVDLINLEDLLPGRSFAQARQTVMANYAEDLTDLHSKLKSDAEFRQLFNGIHRFILEDRMASESGKSKNRIREESKGIALQVIRHSNAWTRFLAFYFPESVRLSIHPYSSHADKIGIQLTKALDNWLTPWHGAMVLTEDGYLLMKKQDAEKMNARLMHKDGQAYYYTLTEPNE